jgi:glutamate dehydrogenase
MQRQNEQRKRALVETVAGLAAERSDAVRGKALAQVIRQFYAHVPPDDLMSRDAENLYGAATSLWDFAQQRRPGHAKIRVFNPRATEHGWHAGRTIVEIANDDMPFLVDSVTAALNGIDLIVHLIIHPVLRLRRDAKGEVVELLDETAGDGDGSLRESLMHVEISEQNDPARREAIAARLTAVLQDVRRAVADWPAMRKALAATLDHLESSKLPMPAREINEVAAFLRWLDDENFTFLGFREYRYRPSGKDDSVVVPKSGLGLLRDDDYSVFDGLRHFTALPPEVRDYLREKRLLTISKSNQRATVHRPAHMDAIGIKTFDDDGEVLGEKLFLGLFTSLAYSRSPRAIPILRLKVQRVLARAGFAPNSHDGKALQHILDTFPRDELLQIGEDELFDTALGILNLQERQRIALFLRRDPLERFVSCLVYVPRDRYSTDLRRRMAAILAEACKGTVAGFTTQLDEAALARVHFMIETVRGRVPAIDAAEVERRLAETGRVWSDRLQEALIAAKGEETALGLLQRYGNAFPTAYRENVPVAEAVFDIDCLETVRGGIELGMKLHRRGSGDPAALGFKIFHAGSPVALSDVLPMLENMGLKVIGEVPHGLTLDGKVGAAWIQDFDLLARVGPENAELAIAEIRPRFEEAFGRVWSGEMENDGFNRLVLAAGLGWRQIVILRLYAKLLRQAGSTFSQAYMEQTLAAHPVIAGLLVALFERQFDPAAQIDDSKAADLAATESIAAAIGQHLDAVANLDEDRILRSFLLLVQKSLRTNYYQHDAAGQPKSYLSVKLASLEIELLPAPRPLVEIFVYSPRVEAIHLRGGKVARGGIRWSDRKEDFRTEILGLMKAQMVKNAVIVPVGSKGGFVVKRPPPAGAGRDAVQAEGIECYKILMRGLLDITDNFAAGNSTGSAIVPPANVVRRDGDDPYLVVAADKGTATFSDIANGVAEDYGFWLGDAFASGGSAGYDHKGMGITARGAWELVKRHFRELGTDIQTTGFTVVGVGDMSGDVFGNGMLLSPHIKLIGAFNHLHIFIDPAPDPARSLKERQRLFDLPRSSWSDYDAKLISKGGGVFERNVKSIALTPEIKAAFGIAVDHMTPAELIRAMLRAPVDLLWFGGIGTYVKASTESAAEAGDRANDPLRIDGREIAARVVGEGANLGVTQRGRIEYALKGGRINTDAIDNSAGVDTSDHEVNLKILLNAVEAAGGFDRAGRDKALAAMTDEVAGLVLRDNYLQGEAISLAERQGVDLLDQEIRLMRGLERAGKLSRTIEFLPDDETLTTRAASRIGLTRPELAVLLSYAKTTLDAELLPSALPDDPELVGDLLRYFPAPLVARYRPAIERHRLRREIIATFVANSLVNRAGITFANEMKERSGRSAGDVAHAYAIIRDAFYLRPFWHAVEALDNIVPAALQYDLMLDAKRLLERATLWLLRSGLTLDLRARVEQFAPGIATLGARLTEILPEPEAAALIARVAALRERGVPEPLAARVPRLDYLVSSADIVRLAEATQGDLIAVGRAYFAVGARFALDLLRAAAEHLQPGTNWQKMAITALIDDFFQHQAELTRKVLDDPAGSGDPLAAWLVRHPDEVAALDALIAEMRAAPTIDLAMLTVANRQLRALAAR